MIPIQHHQMHEPTTSQGKEAPDRTAAGKETLELGSGKSRQSNRSTSDVRLSFSLENPSVTPILLRRSQIPAGFGQAATHPLIHLKFPCSDLQLPHQHSPEQYPVNLQEEERCAEQGAEEAHVGTVGSATKARRAQTSSFTTSCCKRTSCNIFAVASSGAQAWQPAQHEQPPVSAIFPEIALSPKHVLTMFHFFLLFFKEQHQLLVLGAVLGAHRGRPIPYYTGGSRPKGPFCFPLHGARAGVSTRRAPHRQHDRLAGQHRVAKQRLHRHRPCTSTLLDLPGLCDE